MVTGATQGIGRSTAFRLAHDFSSIVLVARNGDELNGLSGRMWPLEVKLTPEYPAPLD
ncbi:MAG TPA: hypothetical protein VFA99_07835 [Acidobacteriaceae bacterium]|nr:hypothetical protein [Acidobacteriaceae bacterium]